MAMCLRRMEPVGGEDDFRSPDGIGLIKRMGELAGKVEGPHPILAMQRHLDDARDNEGAVPDGGAIIVGVIVDDVKLVEQTIETRPNNSERVFVH